MQIGTKDHHEAVAMFDKIAKSNPAMTFRLDKEARDDWKLGRVYQDGVANMAFLAFLQGVVYGRATA